MPIDTSWSLANVGKKISQNVTSLIFPIHPLKYYNLRISHMLVNLLLQAPNASVATASTAAERSSLTSWSNCPASTTLAARTWATATSAAPPRETPPRRASAATRIQTQRQPRPQPHLGLARDSWPAAPVGWKSPSSSSCLPRTILLKGTQVEFKDPNECDTFLKSSWWEDSDECGIEIFHRAPLEKKIF